MTKKKTTRNILESSPWSGTVVTCPMCDAWRRQVDDRRQGWRTLYYHLRSDAHGDILAGQHAKRAIDAIHKQADRDKGIRE